MSVYCTQYSVFSSGDNLTFSLGREDKIGGIVLNKLSLRRRYCEISICYLDNVDIVNSHLDVLMECERPGQRYQIIVPQVNKLLTAMNE